MRIITILICFWFLSCKQSEKNATKQKTIDTVNKYSDTLQSTSNNWIAKSISDLPNYTWRPHHADTTNYICEVRFKDEYAMLFFHGQCIYFFFTYTTYAKDYQQVQLEWTYKTDCMLDMSFLEKTNGVKRRPKHGDTFATYKLINDTTLSVKYEFPDWVQKVNQISQDSLFPQRLYIQKPDGT